MPWRLNRAKLVHGAGNTSMYLPRYCVPTPSDCEASGSPNPDADEVSELRSVEDSDRRHKIDQSANFGELPDLDYEPSEGYTEECPALEQKFDRLVSHSFLSVVTPRKFETPWERGIFKQIFDDSLPGPSLNMEWNCEPASSSSVAEELAEIPRSVVHSGPLIQQAISNLSDVDFETQQTNLCNAACGKWWTIIKFCTLASEVGRQIIQLGRSADQEEGAYRIIEAVIGVRSYNTAICRANVVLRFVRWVYVEQPGIVMPFTESLTWTFLQSMKSMKDDLAPNVCCDPALVLQVREIHFRLRVHGQDPGKSSTQRTQRDHVC